MKKIAIVGPFGANLFVVQEYLLKKSRPFPLTLLHEEDFFEEGMLNVEKLSAELNRIPGPVIVFGHILLSNHEARDLFDVKVFVEASADSCLIQELKTIDEHPELVAECLSNYQQRLKPKNDDVINPSQKYADIRIPNGKTAGLSLLITPIKTYSSTQLNCLFFKDKGPHHHTSDRINDETLSKLHNNIL